MPRISSKNQITLPVAILEQAGLNSGDEVVVEIAEDGEVRVRPGKDTFEDAFGVLTGVYPLGYLDQLDREEEER